MLCYGYTSRALASVSSRSTIPETKNHNDTPLFSAIGPAMINPKGIIVAELNENIKKPYANSLLSLATERHILNGSPLAFGEVPLTVMILKQISGISRKLLILLSGYQA